jgi:hypothetical protein
MENILRFFGEFHGNKEKTKNPPTSSPFPPLSPPKKTPKEAN